jgi:hypothetical protein
MAEIKTLLDLFRAIEGDIDAIKHGQLQLRDSAKRYKERCAQLKTFELEVKAGRLIDRAHCLARRIKQEAGEEPGLGSDTRLSAHSAKGRRRAH